MTTDCPRLIQKVIEFWDLCTPVDTRCHSWKWKEEIIIRGQENAINRPALSFVQSVVVPPP